jgi:hypothetical protein
MYAKPLPWRPLIYFLKMNTIAAEELFSHHTYVPLLPIILHYTSTFAVLLRTAVFFPAFTGVRFAGTFFG